MRKLIIILVLASLNAVIYAQDYFQQEVNYKIEVRLDDQSHFLNAFQEIEYINNSPDELSFIYFHLWPNAYSNSKTALAGQFSSNAKKYLDNEETRGYIHSLNFEVNGKPAKWELDSQYVDICKIYLNEPIKTGESILISTPFRVKIPKGNLSRLGHMEQSYQITQWYPKPAVYDKYGWHAFPYLDMGEFYSEFGSFDVKITLPKNYIVGATGDLQSEEEIDFLNKRAEETAALKEYKEQTTPVSDALTKTLHYRQSNVHDFAWFADKDYLVLKGNVVLPNSGRKVDAWAMFTANTAFVWKRSIEYINDALFYYSKFYGDYPYNQATAVYGGLGAGGGMEYPNITVIGATSTDLMLEMVIMHEVGHNWWYGILASNEREFPWIDEGINSYSEGRYMEEKYGVHYPFYKMIANAEIVGKLLHIEDFSYNELSDMQFQVLPRFKIAQPANLHSVAYNDINYGFTVYKKVALIWNYLWKYLGDEEMDRVMHKFYSEWKFKHPSPDDIRAFFEKETKQDLTWMFDDLLATTKVVDYKVSGLKNNQLEIINIGQINSPVGVYGLRKDSIVFKKWVPGFTGKSIVDLPKLDVDKYQIGYNASMIDYNFQNNTIRSKGLFRNVEPIKLRFAGLLANDKYTNLNFFPVNGYNIYNGYMLGAVFYNDFLPHPKSLEYRIMPMYAFGNKDLSGSGEIIWHYLPDNGLDRFEISLSGKQYAFSGIHNFYRIKAQSDFYLSEVRRSGFIHKIGFKYTRATNFDRSNFFNFVELSASNFYELNHMYNKKDFVSLLKIEANKEFVKASVDLQYEWSYFKNNSISFRLFGGAFLHRLESMNSVYLFNLYGIDGISDYTYSNVYPARFELPGNGFLSNFYVPEEGGFVTYAWDYTKSKSLLAINLFASIPYVPNFIKVYFNAAGINYKDYALNSINAFSSRFVYETGFKLETFNGIFNVYFPMLADNALQSSAINRNPQWKERIRFALNLDLVNPFRLVKEGDLGF